MTSDSGVTALGIVLGFVLGLVALGAAVWSGGQFLAFRRGRSASMTELESLYIRGEITRERFFALRADLVPPPSDQAGITAGMDVGTALPPPATPLQSPVFTAGYAAAGPVGEPRTSRAKSTMPAEEEPPVSGLPE